MTENEFLLEDRIAKIRSTIEKYGEEKFCVSFSGGKDSTVLSALVDMALPQNRIPRVYANTGIELNMVRDFVFEQQKHDDRIQVIKPSVPIKKMLEEEGYPFKSKHHAAMLVNFRNNPENKSAWKYLNRIYKSSRFNCPKKLQYQFDASFPLKISDRCCFRLKEEPLEKWRKENKKIYAITGVMRDEGGRRVKSNCMTYTSSGDLHFFQPLVPITKEWEDWFIQKYSIAISDIYKPPYSSYRTGCKGCPFALHLQEELDMLEKFFPNERKQCEVIWKPVYDEYRRLKYRLKKPYSEEGEAHQLSITDINMSVS